MALSREEKELRVKEYGEKLADAQIAIWSRNKGLTVAQLSELRNALRSAEARAMVIKNSLMYIALRDAGLPVDEEMMGGPCLVTFLGEDIAPAAKALVDFAEDNHEKIEIRGALIGGALAGVEQINTLTELPSREVLLGQVVGGVQAPIRGLVNTLAGVLRGFVTVLQARSEQLEEAAS
ncbi:MAG: 50S ribosomal protein L10 [Chloroflexota bacterium]|nr:50S ribosomal protein L10 [Chloroflexota bacterium]